MPFVGRHQKAIVHGDRKSWSKIAIGDRELADFCNGETTQLNYYANVKSLAAILNGNSDEFPHKYNYTAGPLNLGFASAEPQPRPQTLFLLKAQKDATAAALHGPRHMSPIKHRHFILCGCTRLVASECRIEGVGFSGRETVPGRWAVGFSWCRSNSIFPTEFRDRQKERRKCRQKVLTKGYRIFLKRQS
jgi:hypothetical protein